MDPETAGSMLERASVGELITVDDGRPEATLLPLVHRPGSSSAADASQSPYGSLVMHVARPNRQWHHEGPALVVIGGPDSYVSPRWMPSAADATVVPTWNYRTVHVRGRLIAHDDPAWTRAAVDLLTARHEPEGLFGPGDESAIEAMVRAIVGIELVIEEVVGKDKLSQNKSSADIVAIADALADDEATGAQAEADREVARAMRAVSVPHALAKERLVERARNAGRSPAGE